MPKDANGKSILDKVDLRDTWEVRAAANGTAALCVGDWNTGWGVRKEGFLLQQVSDLRDVMKLLQILYKVKELFGMTLVYF
jgi:hypothetical protein